MLGKTLNLIFTLGGFAVVSVTSFEEPRSLIIFCVSVAGAGIVRYFLQYQEEQKPKNLPIDWLDFFITVFVSFFFGWLGILAVYTFNIINTENTYAVAFVAGAVSLFSTEIKRAIPIIASKFGKKAGFELTDEELEEIKGKRRRNKRNGNNNTDNN